jgi:hypothetical protein
MSAADQTGVDSSYDVAWRYHQVTPQARRAQTGCPSSCLLGVGNTEACPRKTKLSPEDRQEIQAFMNTPADEDAAVKQAIDTVARKIAADSIRLSDYFPQNLRDEDAQAILERILTLAIEWHPDPHAYHAAHELLTLRAQHNECWADT